MSRAKRRVTLPLVVSPPKLPPEPPRRQVSSAVVRAFEQAVKVFNRRQYAEAKPMFESLQTRFPNEVEIISRVQTYIQVCNQKLAHSPSTPRNADELYDRGVYALNIGDFTQARTFFEKALRLRPDEPHLLYSLAATHAQTGSHDQALDYLKRSIQIQPRFRSQALNDSDFSLLRENKQFLEMLGITSPFDRFETRR
jgi:tetratricopeptide (TPR) repeat protein